MKTNSSPTVCFFSTGPLYLSFSFFCFLLQRYLLLFLFLYYLHLYPSPHLSISLFSCSATLFVSISFSLSIPLHISPHIPFSLFQPLLPILSLCLSLSQSPFHRKWFLSQKGGWGVKKGFILSQTKRSVCESSKNTEKKRKGDNNQKPSLIRLSHTHILFSPLLFSIFPFFQASFAHMQPKALTHVYSCVWTQSKQQHISAYTSLQENSIQVRWAACKWHVKMGNCDT